MNPSAEMIVMLNIEHYRKLLMTERDPTKLAIISGLLAEEQGKLIGFPRIPRSSLGGGPLALMSGINKNPSER